MKRFALVTFILLAGCGAPTEEAGPPVDTQLTIDSEFVGEELALKLVAPPGGGEGRPLVVFLHGRDQSIEGVSGAGFRAAYEELGEQAPVFAFPSGGESSFWHDRADGDWGRYVIEEVIPRALDATGADPARVAVGGISMGGFGALDLADDRKWCAIGAHSAAVYTSAAVTAEGAFDDAADFAAHDVIANGDRFPDAVPLYLDIGEEDPFRPGVAAFAAATGERARFFPGTHAIAYWDAHWPDYLRFYSESCQKPG